MNLYFFSKATLGCMAVYNCSQDSKKYFISNKQIIAEGVESKTLLGLASSSGAHHKQNYPYI